MPQPKRLDASPTPGQRAGARTSLRRRAASRARRALLALSCLALLTTSTTACDKNRTDAIVLVNQGVKALERGDVGTARSHFGRAARLDPSNAAAHYHLGLVMLYNAEEPAQALVHFETAQGLASDDVETLYQLGRLLVKQGDAERGLSHLQRASEVDPNHSGAWHHKGVALRKLDRIKEADTALRESIAIDPMVNRSYMALGDLYEAFGADAAARAVFEEGLHHRPRDPDLLNGLGVLALRRGDIDSAVESLTEALSRDGSRVDAAFNLAFALAEGGKAKEAISQLHIYLQHADPVTDKSNLRVARALKETLLGEVD